MLHQGSEVPSEKEDERIDKLAKILVKKFGMGTPSILILETIKPAMFVGGELGRILLTPWLPILGADAERSVHDYISTLIDRDNVEKLISRIEELMKKEDEELKAKKLAKNKESPSSEGILKRIYRRLIGK